MSHHVKERAETESRSRRWLCHQHPGGGGQGGH